MSLWATAVASLLAGNKEEARKFYHRVHDAHVEAQVAARGQRLGRTQDLSIVLIANEGEAYRRE